MPFDNLMVFTGNANPKLAQKVARHLNVSWASERLEVQRRRDHGRAARERPRQGRLRAPVDVRADERHADGAADHVVTRCAARAWRGSPRRCRTSLRPPGTGAEERAVAISAKVVAKHAHDGGSEPRADDGPARDQIRVLRHPVDTSTRRRSCWATCGKARVQGPGGGVAGRGRRVCGRERSPRGSEKRPSRSSTSAAAAQRRTVMTSSATWTGAVRDHGRHGRHGHTLCERARAEEPVRCGCGVLHAPECFRTGHRPHRGLGDRRAGGDRHHPLRADAEACKKIARSASRSCSPDDAKDLEESSVSSLFVE